MKRGGCAGNPLADQDYSAEHFTTDIAVDAYIAGYWDGPRFLELCRQCRNFGNRWGCPPFDFDVEQVLRQYSYAHLMATKITPHEQGLPWTMAREYLRAEHVRIERELLELEERIGGRAFGFNGECLHCPGHGCRRPSGEPCLHPEQVRSSLEAFGFDIGSTLTKLFGIELLWGKEGQMPDYLVLVCGLFHNHPELSHF